MDIESTSRQTHNKSSKYNPVWVVAHFKEAPGYSLHLINRIRKGVSKSEWKDLIRKIGMTEKNFESVLPSSISSMQKKTIYDRATSERIYEIAKLFGLGYQVFDSSADFKKWLNSPSRALGNKTPFDLLDSSFGFEVVKNEITRIQFNVYS